MALDWRRSVSDLGYEMDDEGVWFPKGQKVKKLFWAELGLVLVALSTRIKERCGEHPMVEKAEADLINTAALMVLVKEGMFASKEEVERRAAKLEKDMKEIAEEVVAPVVEMLKKVFGDGVGVVAVEAAPVPELQVAPVKKRRPVKEGEN